MNWQNNPKVSLTFDEQKEVTKQLCSCGGVEIETMHADGFYIGYLTPEIFEAAKNGTLRIGTACGKKDSQLSAEMSDALLSKAEHAVALLYKDDSGRLVIAALGVRGFGRRDGSRMEKLANDAGCSLRPDPVKVCKKEWIFFESE